MSDNKKPKLFGGNNPFGSYDDEFEPTFPDSDLATLEAPNHADDESTIPDLDELMGQDIEEQAADHTAVETPQTFESPLQAGIRSKAYGLTLNQMRKRNRVRDMEAWENMSFGEKAASAARGEPGLIECFLDWERTLTGYEGYKRDPTMHYEDQVVQQAQRFGVRGRRALGILRKDLNEAKSGPEVIETIQKIREIAQETGIKPEKYLRNSEAKLREALAEDITTPLDEVPEAIAKDVRVYRAAHEEKMRIQRSKYHEAQGDELLEQARSKITHLQIGEAGFKAARIGDLLVSTQGMIYRQNGKIAPLAMLPIHLPSEEEAYDTPLKVRRPRFAATNGELTEWFIPQRVAIDEDDETDDERDSDYAWELQRVAYRNGADITSTTKNFEVVTKWHDVIDVLFKKPQDTAEVPDHPHLRVGRNGVLYDVYETDSGLVGEVLGTIADNPAGDRLLQQAEYHRDMAVAGLDITKAYDAIIEYQTAGDHDPREELEAKIQEAHTSIKEAEMPFWSLAADCLEDGVTDPAVHKYILDHVLPFSADAWIHIGQLYEAQGDAMNALNWYAQANRMQTTQPESGIHMMRALHKLDKPNDVLHEKEKFEEATGQTLDADALEELLTHPKPYTGLVGDYLN